MQQQEGRLQDLKPIDKYLQWYHISFVEPC